MNITVQTQSLFFLESQELPAFGKFVAGAGSITRNVAGLISSCSKNGQYPSIC